MRIDNGERRPLVIRDVFEGECGVSRGVLSFVPNRTGRDPLQATAGLLGDDVVLLRDIQRGDDGQTIAARFAVVAR